jgi:hypothetical protein
MWILVIVGRLGNFLKVPMTPIHALLACATRDFA